MGRITEDEFQKARGHPELGVSAHNRQYCSEQQDPSAFMEDEVLLTGNRRKSSFCGFLFNLGGPAQILQVGWIVQGPGNRHSSP